MKAGNATSTGNAQGKAGKDASVIRSQDQELKHSSVIHNSAKADAMHEGGEPIGGTVKMSRERRKLKDA